MRLGGYGSRRVVGGDAAIGQRFIGVTWHAERGLACMCRRWKVVRISKRREGEREGGLGRFFFYDRNSLAGVLRQRRQQQSAVFDGLVCFFPGIAVSRFARG